VAIVADCLEGENCRLCSCQGLTLRFKFNGGRGVVGIAGHGINDLISHGYDERIAVSMPSVFAKMSSSVVCVGLGGQVRAVNHALWGKVRGWELR